jgi:hypothetical protein
MIDANLVIIGFTELDVKTLKVRIYIISSFAKVYVI